MHGSSSSSAATKTSPRDNSGARTRANCRGLCTSVVHVVCHAPARLIPVAPPVDIDRPRCRLLVWLMLYVHGGRNKPPLAVIVASLIRRRGLCQRRAPVITSMIMILGPGSWRPHVRTLAAARVMSPLGASCVLLVLHSIRVVTTMTRRGLSSSRADCFFPSENTCRLKGRHPNRMQITTQAGRTVRAQFLDRRNTDPPEGSSTTSPRLLRTGVRQSRIHACRAATASAIWRCVLEIISINSSRSKC